MTKPRLSRPYACQWTTCYERLNVGPSTRHTLAVRMAVGPGVVGSVHLDAENAGSLLADMAVCMPPAGSQWPLSCLVCPRDTVKVERVEIDDGELPSVELRVGKGAAILALEDARALAIELLRLSNG